MSVTIPTAASQKTIALAKQTSDQDQWLQTIVNQIKETSRVGNLTYNADANYVTAAIKTLLEGQSYVVGSPSNGKVNIAWSA